MGPNDGPQLPIWKGSADYSQLVDSPSVGPGKGFTQTQKKNIYNMNQTWNNGLLRSDLDGQLLVASLKNVAGVTPPRNAAQIDHITPVKPADPSISPKTNSYKNARVLSGPQNRAESNNQEFMQWNTGNLLTHKMSR